MKNKVNVLGRLGQDPEFKALANGMSVVNVSLATSERYKNKDGEVVDSTEWHKLVFWAKRAETAKDLLKKGDLVDIEGKLEYKEYENNEGKTVRYAQIRVDNFLKLEKRDS